MRRVLPVIWMLQILAPVLARAQTVRGVVVTPGGVPVPGVVVQLVDTAGTAARVLTDERGAFRLTAPVGRSYRLVTLRIGYRPMSSEVFSLPEGANLTRRIELTEVSVALGAIRIQERSVCRFARDTLAAAFAVWEQARTALVATELATRTRTVVATNVTWHRVLDASGRRVVQQKATVTTGQMTQPWRSLSADSLRHSGYVLGATEDSTTYYTPGLDMLASDQFIEDHCFRLVHGADDSRIGVAFEPGATRAAIPEIAGTLWLDRATSALLSVDFRYVNVPTDQSQNAGGAIEFTSIKDGTWTVTRWHVRAPKFELRSLRIRRGERSSTASDASVSGFNVSGGTLALVTSGAPGTVDTLWAAPPLTLDGIVVDSVTRAPLLGARVSIVGATGISESNRQGRFVAPAVLPGEYTMEIQTRSLDSVRAMHRVAVVIFEGAADIAIRVPDAATTLAARCARVASPKRPHDAIITGIVTGTDSISVPGATVVAEWTTVAGGLTQSATSVTDEHGLYNLCGVPVNSPILLRAVTDNGASAPLQVVVPLNSRFGSMDLIVGREQSAGDPRGDPLMRPGHVGMVAVQPEGGMRGTVLDTDGHRIAGAHVILEQLRRAATTDSAGRFSLTNVPAGRLDIDVRRIGFEALRATVAVTAGATTSYEFQMARFPQELPAAEVLGASSGSPRLALFEEHRRRGLGKFITTDVLEKHKNRQLSEIMGLIPGPRVVRGTGNSAWVATTRGSGSLVGGNIAPNEMDRRRGAIGACYSAVMLDGMVVFQGLPDEQLFDINTLSPSMIAGIEYYPSVASTPTAYLGSGRRCGILAIWTK